MIFYLLYGIYQTIGLQSLVHFGAPYGGEGGQVPVTRDTRVVRWDRGRGRGDMDIAAATRASDVGWSTESQNSQISCNKLHGLNDALVIKC